MSDSVRRDPDAQVVELAARRRSSPNPTLSGGDGGGTFDPMEARVAALEEGMKDIRAILKEIRDGQQSAAVAAAEQRGDLNTRFAELGTRFAEVHTNFAQVAGQLNGIKETDAGLRRDLDKLPSKFDVATIMVFVIGGLGAVATLLKTIWPWLTRVFGQ